MAEPIPEVPKPQVIVIGETPIYVKVPATVGNETVRSFTVLGKDQRAGSGGGSAVILTREPSRKKENRGQLIEKENLNFDRMDTKNWDEIAGIRFRDEAGNAIDIPKEQLSLTPSSEEKPTITIVGLRAYEGRALDLADRSMQKLSRDLGTVIWKQSIGGIYFHERARQYYLDMLKASETPFAEEAIRAAERRATDIYNTKLADSNFFKRAGTKVVEWLKSAVGMRSAIQTLALDEIGRMKTAGEIKGMETLEREGSAVRKRFEQDYDRADKLIRENLGEKKLELLDESDTRNAPIVTGIKDMMKRYATGEIADKAALDAEAKTFFAKTLKASRPDLIAEAELYTSSLFEAAENLRAKISHEAGIANIDNALAGIQVKLGLAQMGEVTSLEPTAVEKGIGKVREVFEWLNKKHVIVPMVFNEAVIGSGLAIALSAINFFKTVPARAFGAGALAGGLFAGWREYGQLHKDYLTHLRERETGAKFTEIQKRRQWFERFAPQQRSAVEMTKTIEAAVVSGDYRTVMATIADLQARKAVSETGPKRIGLIQYSSRDAIESERTALDLASSRALSDLSNLSDLSSLLGNNSFPDFMEKLTIVQTRVLREGVGVLTTMEDPVHATLNLVSQYAPEAHLLKRRWPFASAQGKPSGTEVKIEGLDAIMEEFKKEARLESVKYGVKAGVIGAAVGVAFRGVEELFSRGVVSDVAEKAKDAINPDAAKPYDFTPGFDDAEKTSIDLHYTDPNHILTIGTTPYQLPDELSVDTTDGKYDVFFRHPDGHRIYLANDLTPDEVKTQLAKAGLSPEAGYAAGDNLPLTKGEIEHLLLPNGKPVMTELPEGWQWKYIADRHSWTLIDTHRDTINQTVASGIEFDEKTGSLVNETELREQLTKQFSNGFSVNTNGPVIYQAPLPVVVAAPPGAEVSSTMEFGDTFTIEGKDLGDGGIWDYFLGKTHDVTDANGMKNLFRLYMHDHADKVTGDIPTRIAYFDGSKEGLQEIDLTKIPNDATFKLPEKMFGDYGIGKFHEYTNEGLKDMNALIAAGHKTVDGIDYVIRGPGDAINFLYEHGNTEEKVEGMVLKLGYWGQDSAFPTDKADLALLYEKLGATVTTTGAGAGAPTVTPPPPIHELIIKATQTETMPARIVAAGDSVTIPYMTPEGWEEVAANAPVSGGAKAAEIAEAARQAAAAEFPWFPIFVPYRSVLEAAIGETAPASAEATAGKERKPQPVAVREYLDGLSEEEKQFLTGLDLVPVSPDLRAAIVIPVSQFHGSNVSGRLSSYLTQDAMNKAEFLVFDTVGVKEDVDKFIAEHPDMKVLYVAGPAYAKASAGAVKRNATNVVLNRIATMPEDSPDVAIVMDNGTGGTISNQYLSSIIDTFDQNANLETVGGAYTLPQEMYSGFPMLFARFRAVELMDAMIRHGEAGGIPPTYAGNLGVRAGSLAAAGGYTPETVSGEDRIMAQAVGNAQTLPAMTAAFDPKEITYATLQSLNLADTEEPLATNETYKNMSWEEMAKKANEAYTNKHLEADLTRIYTAMPQDEYFKRTMDALGIVYEIKGGKVTVLSTDALAQNMAVPLDVEAFAKAETTPREHLEKLAGDQPAATEEKPTEVLSSSLSSPDVSHLSNLSNLEETTQKQEPLSAGVEERMFAALKEATTPEASVQLTPGELMDYIKTSVDIAGSRITEGKIVIDGNTVKLTDMKADIRFNKAHIGEGNFSATLLTDPQKGLVVDHQTLTMKLPFMMKMVGGAKMLREGLDNFNGLVTDHINTRIDPAWKAERIDIVGEKLEIKFTKK